MKTIAIALSVSLFGLIALQIALKQALKSSPDNMLWEILYIIVKMLVYLFVHLWAMYLERWLFAPGVFEAGIPAGQHHAIEIGGEEGIRGDRAQVQQNAAPAARNAAAPVQNAAENEVVGQNAAGAGPLPRPAPGPAPGQ